MSASQQMLNRVRRGFSSGKTMPMSFRIQQMKNVLKMADECQEEILDAIYQDLKKPKIEATLYELECLKCDAQAIFSELDKCASNEKLPFNLASPEDRAFVRKEPYGVVLILGAWNYPILLALQPLLGAIAAGNCAIVKPSEMAPKCSALLSKIFPRYLDQDCYQIFQGDLEETKELLTNKFDYIFATGSMNMGRSVLGAASSHLTPVTLELGGKSPVYIHDSTPNMEYVTKRIIWGKFMNLGQTCIAPDYIICSKKKETEFLNFASRVMTEWFGENWKKSPDLARIVNDKNYSRIKNLLDSTNGRIAFGGETDPNERWVSPTILVDVEDSDVVMEEEIFGPILPIVRADTPEVAIKKILAKPKPLAIYIFSKDTSVIDNIVERTSSGGVCINDVLWQSGWVGLPFGGVGNSGMGAYHAKYSFETFAHKRAILHRSLSCFSEKMGDVRYPPYTQEKFKKMRMIFRYLPKFNLTMGRLTSSILLVLLGFLLGGFLGYEFAFLVNKH